MNRLKLSLLSLLSFTFIAAFSAGCANEVEFGAGTQQAGQVCFGDTDCAGTLICKDRRCTPKTVRREGEPVSPQPDADHNDAGPAPDGGSIDAGPAPDGGPIDAGPAPDISVQPDANSPGCCVGGCADNEFCSQCQCVAYERDVCRHQDQPCHREGAVSNGYYCSSVGNNGELRCYGICDRTSSQADETCPDDHAVCAIGDESGLCMSPCNDSSDCGEPGMGCINYDSSKGPGICVPTNDENKRGETCDPQRFFDCEEGNICLGGEPGQAGICLESCRPFAHDSGNSDCDDGFCLVLTPRWGVCAPNNAFFDGQRCEPTFSMCSEDAVACYPAGQDSMCMRVCRTAEGNADCIAGQTCQRFSADQPDLGICWGAP